MAVIKACTGCGTRMKKGRMRAGYCTKCAAGLRAQYRKEPEQESTFDVERVGMQQFRTTPDQNLGYVRLTRGRAKYAPGKSKKK